MRASILQFPSALQSCGSNWHERSTIPSPALVMLSGHFAAPARSCRGRLLWRRGVWGGPEAAVAGGAQERATGPPASGPTWGGQSAASVCRGRRRPRRGLHRRSLAHPRSLPPLGPPPALPTATAAPTPRRCRCPDSRRGQHGWNLPVPPPPRLWPPTLEVRRQSSRLRHCPHCNGLGA